MRIDADTSFNESGARAHRSGHVYSARGFVPIAKGQVWSHEGPPRWSCDVRATVVGIEDGAVFLKPEDPDAWKKVFFQRQETTKKGELVDVYPFKAYGPEDFKKGPDEWKNGTFAAHEAWYDVWRLMRLLP